MSAGAADIGVVVVTHRSADSIDACLGRLRDAEAVAAVRVVDNASDDATLSLMQRHAAEDPRVRFVANPDNPGFAVACNQGARALADAAAPVRWLAFVNPDCLVEGDTLVRLRAHAAAAERGCLLGADLVDEHGVRDHAARRRDPDFALMLRSPSAMRLGVAMEPGRALQPVDADSGALMLLPHGLFESLHGFDEGYRLHAEDLDLCRRVRTAGAVVAVANDVTVVHLRGVSSRSRPLFVEWHKHRGLWRYFRKFEAGQRNAATRLAIWLAIWMHWASRLPTMLVARR
jgi:GT2 family glycosyltransferase